jgi:hypothetical protein
MCTNEECASDELSINQIGLSVTGLLERYELSRFGHRFGEHLEISERIQDRLIEAIFPLRNLCWECARPSIEMAMDWRFSLLDWGIPLNLHKTIAAALEQISTLPAEWNEYFLRIYAESIKEKRIKTFVSVDLEELTSLVLLAFNSNMSVRGLEEVTHCLDVMTSYAITIEDVRGMVIAGYRNESDMELLCWSELDENGLYFLYSGRIPSRLLLEQISGDIKGYLKYVSVLDGLCSVEFLDSDFEERDVQTLLSTELTPEFLAEISHRLVDDDAMEKIFDDLDDDFVDFHGTDFVKQFANSVRALLSVRLDMTRENLVQFWGLSAAMILHVIDNNLEEEDHYRLARLVDDVKSFDGWLREMDQFDEPQEVGEWAKFGFKPNEAVSWKSSGFEPTSASKWREIVDNPEVARRRSDAGIRLEID